MVTKKQRQRQLARQKLVRQRARRLERRQRVRRRGVIAGVVLAVLAVIAGGYAVSLLFKGDKPASAAATPTATPSASPSPTATGAPRPTKAGECTYVAQEGKDQKSFGLPPAKAPLKDAVATIKTNQGTITADLFGANAGCAVNSFTFLANKNAFDKTTCDTLSTKPATAEYLGCGDVTASGGGPGYIFGNENDGKKTFEPGWLVMAGAENHAGSRFFITSGDSSTFEHPVTVFGKVRDGLDVVQNVAKAGLAPNSGSKGVGRPATSVIIQDVKVTTK
ncbi:peptidylprolyl isomerase [Actinopolymorpha alba]|uniref:peptidylprolyl isomerase n=1 Tax=Actinopolymorpha alba TaxID=533267 RepID=UPI000370715E|nr:peptidylprolyl isomerase [Actinopolymorpha alba]